MRLRYLSIALDVTGVILAGCGLVALAWLAHPFLALFVAGAVLLAGSFVLGLLWPGEK